LPEKNELIKKQKKEKSVFSIVSDLKVEPLVSKTWEINK